MTTFFHRRVSDPTPGPVKGKRKKGPAWKALRDGTLPGPVPSDAPRPPVFVDDDASLAALLSRLDALPSADVSLDTEADSFHHYFEKICLVQLERAGDVFLVDPLAPVPLAPLLGRLAGRRLLMHGADYDLRLLYRNQGFRAGALFDTMIAAQLVGEREIGLQALLFRRLGVVLDKAHQRADWSARPLPPGMVAYAAADVAHLPALVASLKKDLAARGRLAWHEEECARLSSAPFPSQRAADPESDWRIKGTNGLTSKERAFVRALWEVREARARALDLPPFRVMTNERLLPASRLAAAGESDLLKLFPGPRGLPGALATEIRRAFEAARRLPPSAWPPPRHAEAAEADPALERVVEELKRERDRKAKALGLSPDVLASRAVLTAAARALLLERPPSPEHLAAAAGISRWRAELLLSP
jgi:ribonuclease D